MFAGAGRLHGEERGGFSFHVVVAVTESAHGCILNVARTLDRKRWREAGAGLMRAPRGATAKR